MIQNTFDPTKPYCYVRYGRMSTEQQNPRSPEQQYETIDSTLARLRYNWRQIKDFRDDGVSGRYTRKRKGFLKMLEEIRTGILQIDLILVDTLERFGRMDDLSAVRRELQTKCGILILTADTDFADPTSVQGRVYGVVESLRSTEAARIKAHDVCRGKRDTIMQGHWPGGPVPFGYRLHSVLSTRKGREEVDHTVLVPDPRTSWIIQLLFQQAHKSGWGQTRLARFLANHPEIPDEFKPFEPPTIGYWLDNPIYGGTLRWNQYSTDVIHDARVIRKNDAKDVLYAPSFCEPLVKLEVIESIQALRQARREKMTSVKTNGGKQIAPLAPGLTLKYLLTGLVRCGHCNRAMTASSTAAYTTRSGEKRTYTRYVCPGYVGRNCINSKGIPEPWLRQTVVDIIRQRLFPASECTDPCESTWYQPLANEVRKELERLSASRIDHRPALNAELADTGDRIQGWILTLSKRELDSAVRQLIEDEMRLAVARKEEIKTALLQLDGQQDYADGLLNPSAILKRLARLDELLGANNPTAGNLELSLHIDRIACFSDGRVVMRTCKLGALAGTTNLLRSESAVTDDSGTRDGTHQVKPRRRAQLRVDKPLTGGEDLQEAVGFAADPERFAGLDPKWFWEDVFYLPQKESWTHEHADEVWQLRNVDKLPWTQITRLLGKSRPTLRKALRHAEQERAQESSADNNDLNDL
jgi:DNA invertase Pin-like site-specific DNA recombinase